MTAILILGVDPGLNKCGWGLVASEGSRLSHVAHGVIKPVQTTTARVAFA
jgi:crossover junction endodeoxyribonuclease RuvC